MFYNILCSIYRSLEKLYLDNIKILSYYPRTLIFGNLQQLVLVYEIKFGMYDNLLLPDRIYKSGARNLGRNFRKINGNIAFFDVIMASNSSVSSN